ncbi:MAG TPA: hypothetical protein DCP92_05165 [Nitrospiraceae bacterium]|nr:hypothetical protein [Nitrospiraceae bacterium]
MENYCKGLCRFSKTYGGNRRSSRIEKPFPEEASRLSGSFYRSLSKTDLRSEQAGAFKSRFEKNREKLFTFLVHDGVPWNNNNAEHAIKAFATLRRVINGITSEKGIREYLVMFSISETCKYKEVEFLDFLRSGEKDIHAFAESKRRKRLEKVQLPEA